MIRKRRGFWHYRFQVEGREYSGTTGLVDTNRNRNDAAEFATNRRKEILGREGVEPIPFIDASVQFLQWCEQVEYRQKPGTWQRIKVSFTSLMTFFHEKRVPELTPGDMEQYKHWRLTEHRVREITLRHDLHAFLVFLRYAKKRKWLQSDPMEDVSIPSDRDAMREYVLSPDEESRYFARAAECKDRNGRRNLYDLGRLMILQGCRPEELMTLRKDHVDLGSMQIRIEAGKTKSARRTLDLCDESAAILSARMGGDSEWVFPSDRTKGRPVGKLQCPHDKVCRETGVSFVIYDLRHTFATRLIQSGCDVPTAAAILGHNGLRTIYRYVHPTAPHKKEAMQKFDAAQTRRKLKVV